jgi:hypothetical protein
MPKNITKTEPDIEKESFKLLSVCLRKFGNKKINYLYKLSRYLYTSGHKKEALCVNKLITDII